MPLTSKLTPALQLSLRAAVAAMLALMFRPATAKVAGYVCGIVLLDHGDSPWSYAFFRMIETALGIGMAMCVSLVPKLLTTNGSKRKTE